MADDYDGFDFKIQRVQPPKIVIKSLSHYYGDAVRRLFLIAGIVMLVTLPFVSDRISLTLFSSIIAILILAFSAGITSPRQKWVHILNVTVSLGGFIVFAFHAVIKFSTLFDLLFVTNITLSCILLVAFYLSIKTARGTRSFDKQAKKEGAPRPFSDFENKVAEGNEIKKEGPANKTNEEEARRKRFLSQDTQ